MSPATEQQTLIDQFAIIDVMNRYAAGLDARDWQLWRSVFTRRAVFDLSSWNKVAPKEMDTDKVVRRQARIFAELTTTQHFLANHRITISNKGDTARGIAHMRAEHWLEDAEGQNLRYTMFGYYDDRFVRTDQGWKMSVMQLNVTQTEGQVSVMRLAEQRALDKHKAKTER